MTGESITYCDYAASAMGQNEDRAFQSIRISSGYGTDENDVAQVTRALISQVSRLSIFQPEYETTTND